MATITLTVDVTDTEQAILLNDLLSIDDWLQGAMDGKKANLVVITIDGVEYNPEDLSDEVKYMVAQVKDIDDKLGHLRFQVDQLSAAKIAFSDAIVKGVTDASQE
jgi:hypothetical protein